MKILWLCNVVLPAVCEELGIRGGASGGWLEGSANCVSKENELHIISVYQVEKIIKIEKEHIVFHIAPNGNATDNRENFKRIINEIKPDIVHIWGTEYTHTFDMVTACEELGITNRLVISIQGLCSIIAKHYYAGLPSEIINTYTIRDLIKRENIKKQKQLFEKRGSFEIAALKKAKHVIGRTDWDKACVLQINPNINYHFCNETLRESFYNNKWEYDKCEKHSIFVSQGHYPIKGLHFVLEALAILKKEYPDVKLYVGGVNMVNRGWKISSYGKYIKELIKKYDLSQNIQFTGMLNEKKMCEQYLKANVFVSASSIENSSNSLCEAMMLGVPSVSSDVGGVKSLYRHEEDGYIYPYDEPYMLAYYVKEIFDCKGNVVNMCQKARQRALETHNKEQNTQQLIKIYEKIQGFTDE